MNEKIVILFYSLLASSKYPKKGTLGLKINGLLEIDNTFERFVKTAFTVIYLFQFFPVKTTISILKFCSTQSTPHTRSF